MGHFQAFFEVLKVCKKDQKLSLKMTKISSFERQKIKSSYYIVIGKPRDLGCIKLGFVT